MSNYSIKPDGFQEAIAMLNIMHEEATGERGHYRSTYLNSGLILLDWSTESVIYTEAASFDEDELRSFFIWCLVCELCDRT